MDIFLIDLLAIQLKRKDDVVINADRWNQVEALEDKSDLSSSEDAELVALKSLDVLVIYNDLSLSWIIKPAQHVKQC